MSNYHRSSHRLKRYDYTQPGAYFVTICTYRKECTLSKIVAGVVQLSHLGKIVEHEWLRTPKVRSYVELDCYVIMPNHFHGIMIIKRNSSHPKTVSKIRNGPTSNSISAVIGQFKSQVTKRWRIANQNPQLEVWQRNFYDKIIRDEFALETIRAYILNNPLSWATDSLNLQHIPIRRGDPLT